MDLYFMQHGEAAPEQQDPARPLTPRGRGDVERVARHAARLDLGIGAILHSGKLRARQTAEIVAARLRPSPPLEELAGLAPNDEPALVAGRLDQAGAPVLLVGHLPHLSRLLSLLVVGDAQRALLAFRMGGLVALRRDDEGWRLRFVLTPELVRD